MQAPIALTEPPKQGSVWREHSTGYTCVVSGYLDSEELVQVSILDTEPPNAVRPFKNWYCNFEEVYFDDVSEGFGPVMGYCLSDLTNN